MPTIPLNFLSVDVIDGRTLFRSPLRHAVQEYCEPFATQVRSVAVLRKVGQHYRSVLLVCLHVRARLAVRHKTLQVPNGSRKQFNFIQQWVGTIIPVIFSTKRSINKNTIESKI